MEEAGLENLRLILIATPSGASRILAISFLCLAGSKAVKVLSVFGIFSKNLFESSANALDISQRLFSS